MCMCMREREREPEQRSPVSMHVAMAEIGLIPLIAYTLFFNLFIYIYDSIYIYIYIYICLCLEIVKDYAFSATRIWL
jgi:hypothetical protein